MDFTILDNLKKSLNIDIYSLLDEVFKTNQVQSTMIEFNQDQLQAGLATDGTIIITKKAEFEQNGYPYALKTISIKKEKNQKYDKVTLYDTGRFYKTFKVKILKDGYSIIANFSAKDGSILKNFDEFYHDKILGVDSEGIQELVDQYVLPILSQLLRKKLGL